ncbi:MAG: NfeD family protein [Rhodobacteraceae bacterium]|nr:NfeD family protein [Paracoccaceae bacterium]
MPILDLLEGLSPWWWVALAFALGALEIVTGTYVLIWVCLAAFQMAFLLWIMPGLSGDVQITLFAVVAVVLTFAGRWLMQHYGDGGQEHATLNSRPDHLVGRIGKVLNFDTGTGAVEVDGTRWRANWPDGELAEPGAKVKVTSANRMTLEVRNLRRQVIRRPVAAAVSSSDKSVRSRGSDTGVNL